MHSNPTIENKELAIFGGRPVVTSPRDDLMLWPFIGDEDRKAAMQVINARNFFDEEQVSKFEEEFAKWLGVKYAIAMVNGTSGIHAAMWACGLRRGDEIICPSKTYWAAVLPAMSLGAVIVFADISPESLGIDPDDIEHRITPQTRAILVVHQYGYPVDMDKITALARKHRLKVIEDASHAHGSQFRGRLVGTLADVAVFSCCGKTLSIGEGGMLATNDRDIYERTLAFANNFRFNRGNVTNEELLPFAHLPMGGVTTRMHNISAAMGRVQLRYLPARIAEIERAMSLFCELIDGLPGIQVHRPSLGSGSKMGGWYLPHAKFFSEQLNGLSVSRFAEAVRAEGWWTRTRTCISDNLHLHPLLKIADVYGDGQPTRTAHSKGEVKDTALKVSENIKIFTIPRFTVYDKEAIECYANVFHKVIKNHEQLLVGDRGDNFVIPDDRGDG